MTAFIIYQKYSYANPSRLDRARDAWRRDGAQRRPAERRRHLDGRGEAVRAGAAATAAPDRKPTASAGFRDGSCRFAGPGRRPVCTGGGGAGQRPASAMCQVPAYFTAPIAHQLDINRGT